jgi:hypothetical protein
LEDAALVGGINEGASGDWLPADGNFSAWVGGLDDEGPIEMTAVCGLTFTTSFSSTKYEKILDPTLLI